MVPVSPIDTVETIEIGSTHNPAATSVRTLVVKRIADASAGLWFVDFDNTGAAVGANFVRPGRDLAEITTKCYPLWCSASINAAASTATNLVLKGKTSSALVNPLALVGGVMALGGFSDVRAHAYQRKLFTIADTLMPAGINAQFPLAGLCGEDVSVGSSVVGAARQIVHSHSFTYPSYTANSLVDLAEVPVQMLYGGRVKLNARVHGRRTVGSTDGLGLIIELKVEGIRAGGTAVERVRLARTYPNLQAGIPADWMVTVSDVADFDNLYTYDGVSIGPFMPSAFIISSGYGDASDTIEVIDGRLDVQPVDQSPRDPGYMISVVEGYDVTQQLFAKFVTEVSVSRQLEGEWHAMHANSDYIPRHEQEDAQLMMMLAVAKGGDSFMSSGHASASFGSFLKKIGPSIGKVFKTAAKVAAPMVAAKSPAAGAILSQIGDL